MKKYHPARQQGVQGDYMRMKRKSTGMGWTGSSFHVEKTAL